MLSQSMPDSHVLSALHLPAGVIRREARCVMGICHVLDPQICLIQGVNVVRGGSVELLTAF